MHNMRWPPDSSMSLSGHLWCITSLAKRHTFQHHSFVSSPASLSSVPEIRSLHQTHRHMSSQSQPDTPTHLSTCSNDVFQRGSLVLSSETADDGASSSSARELIRAVAEGTLANAEKSLPWPPPEYVWRARTATQILSFSPLCRILTPLPLGCLSVDAQLGGGIPGGAVVEVSGKAGSGKTQLALSLAAETVIRPADKAILSAPEGYAPAQAGAQFRLAAFRDASSPVPQAEALREHLPKSEPAVVYYIHTEGGFPVHRLNEIVTSRSMRLNAETSNNGLGGGLTCPSPKTLMQRIFMDETSSEEQLWIVLTRRLPRLFISYCVRLVVIDSIAAIFRATEAPEFHGKGLMDRATKLMRVGALLRRYAAEYGCCCLVLNQVSDSFSADTGPGLSRNRETMVGRLAQCRTIGRDQRSDVHESNGPNGMKRAECWRSGCEGIDGTMVWRDFQATNIPFFIAGEHSGVQPALGCTWSNCVDFRFMVHKLSQTRSEVVYEDTFSGTMEKTGSGLRCLRSVFGPGIASREIFFKIETQGVVDP